MKGILIMPVAAVLLLATTSVVAQVYTCTVGDRKVYQSTPCTAGDRPVKLYVPPAPDYVPQHGSNDHVRQYLEQGRSNRRHADDVLERRALDARNSRLEKKQAEAEKLRIQRAVVDNQVVIGMTAENVLDAWGRPDRINTSTYQQGVAREQWVYKDRSGKRSYVYLENGIVVSRN